jgi:arylsulfatase A
MRPLWLLATLSIVALTTVFSPGMNQATAATPTPPNVVVIFIDDMGYGDINPFAANNYPTPNLDRMAREGRKFSDFVVSSAVCSASRAALITGCYHRRVGISGALGPQSNIGINESETTIAEICKSKGYATACYGKWHLGHHAKFLPTRHGFDHYFGLPYSNDMWPLHPETVAKLKQNPKAKSNWPPLPLLEAHGDGEPIVLNADVQPKDQEQLTKQYTEHATAFIRENQSRPFFLYLPHSMVHVPLYVSDEFKGKSGAGLFGDVVMEVDWSVGQILDTLDETGLSENTLVVFTSDNGPWLSYGDHAGHAGGLREGKGTMFEGGYRVPTLMRWTGKNLSKATIPAGTECDKLASTIDLLPTVAALIDAELPAHKIDGHDIRSLMLEDGDAKSPHDYFYCYYDKASLQAVRNERWKLHLPHQYRTLAGREGGTGGNPVPYQTASIGLVLYDLDNDVSESIDVSAEYPEIVEELKAAAERAREDLGDANPPREGNGVRPAGTL